MSSGGLMVVRAIPAWRAIILPDRTQPRGGEFASRMRISQRIPDAFTLLCKDLQNTVGYFVGNTANCQDGVTGGDAAMFATTDREVSQPDPEAYRQRGYFSPV